MSASRGRSRALSLILVSALAATPFGAARAGAPAPPTAPAIAEPWKTLPTPPPLPPWRTAGRVAHDGARIWFATFGDGRPVLLLHGDDASSDVWGFQVPALVADGRRVIVIDSRGHGRSSMGAGPLGYEQMAADVVAVMDTLEIARADVVGWSDGAIIGLVMAMKDPTRVDRLFAFGANAGPEGLNPLGVLSPMRRKADALLAQDYAAVSETPNGFGALARAVRAMQMGQPHFAAADLAAINGSKIAIVDGDHEEFIRPGHTRYIAHALPGATLIILPDVGHFAPLQAPETFNAAMVSFLDTPTPAAPAP